MRIINKLTVLSAVGPYAFHKFSFSLKMLVPLCHPFIFIFYLLFDDGCLPPIWRKAFITAIHKRVTVVFLLIIIGQFH